MRGSDSCGCGLEFSCSVVSSQRPYVSMLMMCISESTPYNRESQPPSFWSCRLYPSLFISVSVYNKWTGSFLLLFFFFCSAGDMFHLSKTCFPCRNEAVCCPIWGELHLVATPSVLFDVIYGWRGVVLEGWGIRSVAYRGTTRLVGGLLLLEVHTSFRFFCVGGKLNFSFFWRPHGMVSTHPCGGKAIGDNRISTCALGCHPSVDCHECYGCCISLFPRFERC